MPVDLMALAEGVGDEPRKTRALHDLRTGSTINKSLLSMFEQPNAEEDSPRSPRLSSGKVWTPPKPKPEEVAEPEPKPRLSTGKVWTPPKPKPEEVAESEPKLRLSTGKVWTPPAKPTQLPQEPMPSYSTGKVWTRRTEGMDAHVDRVPERIKSKSAIQDSPSSVATLPDFSALRDEPQEDLPSSPITSNPFLQQDATKRKSLTLPKPVLDITDGTAAANAVDRRPSIEKMRFAPAKKLPPSPRSEGQAAKQPAETAERSAITTVAEERTTEAETDTSTAVAAQPSDAPPADSDTSLAQSSTPPQHSTAWLLSVNGMAAEAAQIDVSDGATAASDAASTGDQAPKSPRRMSFKNLFSRKSSSK